MGGSFQGLFLQEQCNICQDPKPLHSLIGMNMVYDLFVPHKSQKECVK